MSNLVSNVIVAVVALAVGVWVGIWWQKRKCTCQKPQTLNKQENKPELKPAVQAPNEPQK